MCPINSVCNSRLYFLQLKAGADEPLLKKWQIRGFIQNVTNGPLFKKVAIF